MAKLVLEDGAEYIGVSFGHNSAATGEIVFQTGMVGYVESLTDPSYYGQILVLTYPLIGNYGVQAKLYTKDKLIKTPFQSDKIQVRAVIVGDYIDDMSHWTAERTLSQWLKEEGVPAITGVDTRALTKRLRENGTMLGQIVQSKGELIETIPDPNKENLIATVSCKVTNQITYIICLFIY
ncbi:Carbamoyl-phosphate synthase small subunit [Oopsacas minuta]|uniref:Carbamoyl-phosphate synthase small subunit n=1 Tax=Oopsacas minuta TaxID=111878 RepID=A0AAV7KD93_9METZ|nr:Carbamoyl-phosphate synthase small subunit [Oopsacas minuta]